MTFKRQEATETVAQGGHGGSRRDANNAYYMATNAGVPQLIK